MTDDIVTTYGLGGFIPDAPQGNVAATVAVPVPITEVNRRTLTSKAGQALATNAAFLAIASPTAAQNAAQIKALTRQVNPGYTPKPEIHIVMMGLLTVVLGVPTRPDPPDDPPTDN
ncbi:MAG: hypothetical protein NTX33_04825 [Propionibacteriales bacterium]|nr:hypothetical protein [Propionibacteriales bacterium]